MKGLSEMAADNVHDTSLTTDVDLRLAQQAGCCSDILDVGCGDGRLSWFLAKHTRGQVVCLDLSDSGFSKARKSADEAGVGHLVRCSRGDVNRLEFPDGLFDAVVLAYTLHHIVGDLGVTLSELRRVLKPGGKLLVAELENKDGEQSAACVRFGLGELLTILTAAGFQGVGWERPENGIMLVSATKAMVKVVREPVSLRKAHRTGRKSDRARTFG